MGIYVQKVLQFWDIATIQYLRLRREVSLRSISTFLAETKTITKQWLSRGVPSGGVLNGRGM